MNTALTRLTVRGHPRDHSADHQRSRTDHRAKHLPSLRRQKSKQKLRRGETDTRTLLLAFEGVLRAPLHFFELCNLERHSFHLIASTLRRRAKNPPAAR